MYRRMDESRDKNKFMVRMPPGLRERIAESARLAGRSMNSEIVQTLEATYPDEPTMDEVALYARDVAKIYLEAPDNGTLRHLRDLLRQIVEMAGAQHNEADIA